MSFVTIKKFRRALLAPRRPLLKEWAYAGLIFTYTGAAASHLVMRDGVGALVAPMIFSLRASFVGFASGVSSTSCSGLKPVGRWEELSGGNLFRELCCFSRSHDRTVLETKADSETALPVMGREAPGFERR
jgi:DoxX-like family